MEECKEKWDVKELKQSQLVQFEEMCQQKNTMECVQQWKTCFEKHEASAAFDLLLKYKKAEEVVSVLAVVYGERRKELVSRISEVVGLQIRKTEIKTIGIFYYRIAQGGVQKVISLLIPMYLEMGYKVVLFTDEIEEGKEYPISKQVVRVLLPSALTIAFKNYGERAKLISEAMEKYQMDVMLYHASECRTLVYDMLLVKSFGVPFCVTVHGLFSAEMLRQDYYIDEKMVTFKLADCLIVLSEMEAYFWKSLDIKAVYIPNPIEEFSYSEGNGEYILWLGRLEESSKQYMHAVDIMERVVRSIPKAQMKIVGNEVTRGAKTALHKKVKKLHLEENIEICDFTLNVAEYYQNAQVFLVTSSGEAFSMTIVESKGYGIPLVTYNMPYLEVLKQGKGYISVAQDDIEGAATAILKLLKDRQLQTKMKREARESYELLRDTDLKAEWKQLLDSILVVNKEAVARGEENVLAKQMLSTMLLHYKKGCMRSGILSEYAVVRFLAKLNRLYLVYRENGFRMTWKIMKNKIGSKK